jgi:hypothetical protein
MRYPPYRERRLSDETKAKISAANKGHTVSEFARRMASRANKGKVVSEETRAKMSASGTGKHSIVHSDETRRKISDANKGRKRTEEQRRAMMGENSNSWKGGISFAPYCPKFTREFKERVREFFGRVCVECGKPEGENGRRLDVHHVNFRKDACCADDVAPLFVPLCRSCHMTTNGNREYWEARFTALINDEHGGRCYLPKADCQNPIEAKA